MSATRRLSDREVVGRIYQAMETVGMMDVVQRIMPIFDSDQWEDDYSWIGHTPEFQKWEGNRVIKDFLGHEFTIRNEEYEATLRVKRRDLSMDKTGQLQRRINEFAGAAVRHWLRLLATLILGGSSTACYDGGYYFSATHPTEGTSGEQSNKLSYDIAGSATDKPGTTTNPSALAMGDAILAAIVAILSFKNDQGEPVNELASQFDVCVPTSLMPAATKAVAQILTSGGESNPLAAIGAAEGLSINIATMPRLNAWTNKFAVFRSDGSAMPMVGQQVGGVRLEVLGDGSDHAFKTNEHLYGLDAMRGGGYGLWQYAAEMTLTNSG